MKSMQRKILHKGASAVASAAFRRQVALLPPEQRAKFDKLYREGCDAAVMLNKAFAGIAYNFSVTKTTTRFTMNTDRRRYKMATPPAAAQVVDAHDNGVPCKDIWVLWDLEGRELIYNEPYTRRVLGAPRAPRKDKGGRHASPTFSREAFVS